MAAGVEISKRIVLINTLSAATYKALTLTVTVQVNESVVRLPFAELAPCPLSYFEAPSLSEGMHGNRRVTGRGFTEHQWDLHGRLAATGA